MKRIIRQIKGYSFKVFCLSVVISYFSEIGLEILLYSGLPSGLFFLIEALINRPKNPLQIFLYLGLSLEILALVAYSAEHRYQSSLEISGLVSIGIWFIYVQINGTLRREISELINTWHLKICLSLILVYALLPQIGIHQREYVLMGIFILLAIWSIQSLILKPIDGRSNKNIDLPS